MNTFNLLNRINHHFAGNNRRAYVGYSEQMNTNYANMAEIHLWTLQALAFVLNRIINSGRAAAGGLISHAVIIEFNRRGWVCNHVLVRAFRLEIPS